MTKLRFVIGDRDERYLKRLSDYITFHYGDRIEIYTFTELEMLLSFIETSKVNGVFVGKGFASIKEKIMPHMIFAYLSEGIETEMYEGVVMLMKYQSADALIKEMIALCSEQVAEVKQGKKAGGKGKIILFESPIGGVGTSLASAACACCFSKHGKRALYLNMERFGVVNGLFQGVGRFDFSDVIYALKSKKVNLKLKFESIVRQDISGTFFVEPCGQPVDLQSLTEEEARRLFEFLTGEDGYDAIILDRESGLDSLDKIFREVADEIILVADADGKQNEKLQKFIHAIKNMEQRTQVELSEKLQILYNRYNGRSCQNELEASIRSLGRIPNIERLTERRMIERFAAEEIFLKLL